MEPNRLYRSRDDRIIAGVASGLANYFNIDPTIVRILFIALLFAGGTGFWVYIVGWILIPEEPLAEAKGEGSTDSSPVTQRVREVADDIQELMQSRRARHEGHVVGGLLLLILGVAFLFQNIFSIHVWRIFWPLLLIIVGLTILLKSSRKGRIAGKGDNK